MDESYTHNEASVQAILASVWKELSAATDEFVRVAESFSATEINTLPYAGGWTAAQVAEHVTRSNTGIVRSLEKTGKPVDRPPDAGVENLKTTFLNFDKKLQSPEFILPTKDQYSRNDLIEELKRSIESLFNVGRAQDLTLEITHPIFGNVTKIEILYFVVFHTQRHVHQLEKIKKYLV